MCKIEPISSNCGCWCHCSSCWTLSLSAWSTFATSDHINTICANLGMEKSRGTPSFPCFYRGVTQHPQKQTVCLAYLKFISRSYVHSVLHIAQHPHEPIGLSSDHFLVLERFCTKNLAVIATSPAENFFARKTSDICPVSTHKASRYNRKQ